MKPPSCLGCDFHRIKYILSFADHRDRCARPQTHTSGSRIPISENGVDCQFETDSCPEPQRIAGDKCGPDRNHYKATEHVL